MSESCLTCGTVITSNRRRYCSHACWPRVVCHICGKTYPIRAGKGSRCYRCAALGRHETAEHRFWSYVNKTDGGCWEWTGCTDSKGYGQVGIKKNGRWVNTGAHRIAWKLCHGRIPKGTYVCHRCDNPRCVNPGHLFLGDAKINAEDMVSKGRSTRGEKNRRHKLRWDNIPLIRLSAFAGMDLSLLAKNHGVAVSTIRNAVNGKSWRESSEERRSFEEFWGALSSS
jgi:hypothetical protein